MINSENTISQDTLEKEDGVLEIVDLPFEEGGKPNRLVLLSGRLLAQVLTWRPKPIPIKLQVKALRGSFRSQQIAKGDREGDDSELEIVDLPPEEADNASRLAVLGGRLLSQVLIRQSMKVKSREVANRDEEEAQIAKQTSDEEQNDQLEIMDLPPVEDGNIASDAPKPESIRPRLLLQPKAHIPRTRLSLKSPIWRVLTAMCLLVFVLLVIVQTFPSAGSQFLSFFIHPIIPPTPTIQLGSENLSSIQVQIEPGGGIVIWDGPSDGTAIPGRPIAVGKVPQNCPAGPPAAVGNTHTVGHVPVWLSGFEGPTATLHIGQDGSAWDRVPAGEVWYGFGTPIIVLVPTDFTNVVTLSGQNLSDGPPLLFASGVGQTPSASLTLNPQVFPPSPLLRHQRQGWPVIIFLQKAGCYSLHAQWSGASSGEWQVNFAAGA